MKALILAAGLSAALAACTSTSKTTEAVRISCLAFAIHLDLATDFKKAGKLSTSHIEAIDDLVDYVEPICTADEPPADAIQAVADATALLVAVTADVGE